MIFGDGESNGVI